MAIGVDLHSELARYGPDSSACSTHCRAGEVLDACDAFILLMRPTEMESVPFDSQSTMLSTWCLLC